jgi:hypothetical protein
MEWEKDEWAQEVLGDILKSSTLWWVEKRVQNLDSIYQICSFWNSVKPKLKKF